MKMEQPEQKQHKSFGGRTRTSGANEQGSGPVYDLRKASGLIQTEFALQVGMSATAVRTCEREGRLPKSRSALVALRAFAKQEGLPFAL